MLSIKEKAALVFHPASCYSEQEETRKVEKVMKQTFRKGSLCFPACGVLALVSVWAFSILLRIGRIEFLFLLSILTMLLWVLCRKQSAVNARPMNRRLAVITLLPGLLFSAMMVLGSNVIRFETADLLQPNGEGDILPTQKGRDILPRLAAERAKNG